MSGAVYYPSLAYLAGITNAIQAVATFTTPHDFTPGEYISFRVSPVWGMKEINNQRGLVLLTTPLTAIVDINTSGYTPFIIPISVGEIPAIAVPAGSGVIPHSVPPTMNLQDAFDVQPT